MPQKYFSVNEFIKKEEFDIKDLSALTGRKSQTIRLWEKNRIIDEADLRDARNWRVYSRKCFIKNLEKVLNYDWGRQRFSDEKIDEIKYIIELLKEQEKRNK